MNPIDSYIRDQVLPHTATACPELEALVILDAIKRYPGQKKGLVAATALGVFGRELGQIRLMLTYIDSLVTTKLVYRHDFGFYLTPSGVERLERLKENLRGPMMRVMV